MGTEVLTHRQMQDGKWYKLTPPSKIGGKEFPRVCCEYQVPAHPNRYVVRGVPKGERDEESFVLTFTDKGNTQITPAEDQPKKPRLRLVK